MKRINARKLDEDIAAWDESDNVEATESEKNR